MSASYPTRPIGEPTPGPYTADDIRQGDRYELSNGYKVRCMSQSGRSSQDEAGGVAVILADPANHDTGVDTGYSNSSRRLRAPDIAVGAIPDEPGWVKGAPLLAVEFADTGQNEDQLQAKISEFLESGTRYIWVARLVGPRRVEVYEPGCKVRLLTEDDTLTAPGVLKNPVPVRALFDKDAALEATLRNLLNRKGYADLQAVRAEAEAKARVDAKAEAILTALTARGLAPGGEVRARVLACQDLATLDRWLIRAVVTTAAAEIFQE